MGDIFNLGSAFSSQLLLEFGIFGVSSAFLARARHIWLKFGLLIAQNFFAHLSRLHILSIDENQEHKV